MQIPNLDEILNNSSILPSRDIGIANLNHFYIENQQLPRQVKLLIQVTDPTSINSGNIFFNEEELFWISSPLKLILFNPKKLSNVIEYNIEYPIQIMFSYNLYLILTHSDSFVTLINFPKKFSELFHNNEVEDYNFYSYTKNKKSILKSKLYEPMRRPVPSSFQITAAQGSYIGCSDGVIRSFQVVGHYPESNFFIKKLIVSKPPLARQKRNPILSLKICGNILYSLDVANNLTAYLITKNNSITQIDIPINLPGKFLNMAPFSDSIILTKRKGSNLMVATILNSMKSFRIKKDGVIICSEIKSNFVIHDFNPKDSIYLLNNCKKDDKDMKRKEGITALWPTSINETQASASEGTVIISLKYCYYKNEDEYNNAAENYSKFVCRVKVGYVIAFAYEEFRPPIPFINMSDQFFPFSVNESKKEKITFHIDDNRSISLKPICINIDEIDDLEDKSSDKNDEIGYKDSCLCVIGNYSLCPSSEQDDYQKTIENQFGISEITHSIWSNHGSLFCIIYNVQPNFGYLLTYQFGINPVAQLQIITGSILSYSAINKSDNSITKFKEIDTNSRESLFIFTSEGLLTIYLNKESSYKNQVQLNSIKHLFPFYMKRATVKNLSDFQMMFEDEFSSICPEKKDEEKGNKNKYVSCQAICNQIKSVVNDEDMDRTVSNLHLDAIINNYQSMESAIKNFIERKNAEKEKTTKIRPARSRTNSILSLLTPSASTTITNRDKEISTLYDTFNDIKHNESEMLEEYAKEIAETEQNSQKFKVDCLSTWIADEISKSMGKADDKTLKSLSNAQESLLSFYETELFE